MKWLDLRHNRVLEPVYRRLVRVLNDLHELAELLVSVWNTLFEFGLGFGRSTTCACAVGAISRVARDSARTAGRRAVRCWEAMADSLGIRVVVNLAVGWRPFAGARQ